jgi:anti-anti-sigma regulatory factor
MVEWCLESTTSVVFDFAEVTFIDGAAMSLLHDALERVGEDGWLGVGRPLTRNERLFATAGLSALPNFRAFSTLEEALEVIDRG